MTIDSETQRILTNLQNRRSQYLAEVPPNRGAARVLEGFIDEVIDRRPRQVGVTPDGEVVYDNASPWVAGQALVNDAGETVAVVR